ncbi:hypothetical protein Tco_0478299 [Tanacetum coccineum]
MEGNFDLWKAWIRRVKWIELSKSKLHTLVPYLNMIKGEEGVTKTICNIEDTIVIIDETILQLCQRNWGLVLAMYQEEDNDENLVKSNMISNPLACFNTAYPEEWIRYIDFLYSFRTSSNIRNQATVQNGRVVLQNVKGRQNRGQGNNARGAVAAGNGDFQNILQCKSSQAKRLNTTLDDDVDEPLVQDLALNVDNFFQADQCNAFDSDVDEAPTAQTMFMENLSSADPIYDEVSPSYDSNILSEVKDHDNYIDSVGEYHEVHDMQNDVQQNYVVNSEAEYTSDSNIILCEQYVKDNVVQVIQSNVSSVPNDALMMIINICQNRLPKWIAMQVQSALYNGHEIVKTNHTPTIVHDSKDTLEIAEITRKRMLEKMKIPLWIGGKIKIAPPYYSKENYLAIFTPQK